MADDKGLPVLCRIVRFERSTLLSKQAAVAVLGQRTHREAWPRREGIVFGRAAQCFQVAQTAQRGINGRLAAACVEIRVGAEKIEGLDSVAAGRQLARCIAAQ